MASDLLTIARSGAKAARIALDTTAQNIANASTDGYVRRSVDLSEVAVTGGVITRTNDATFSGVRLDRIVRNADAFRQAEVRRTGADAARATAQVSGLSDVEAAVEQSGVYASITGFEASLQQLATNPTDASLRSSVIAGATSLASAFNIAGHGLDAAGTGVRAEAADGVTQVNLLATQLARVNQQITRVSNSSADTGTLLDRRDLLLQKLSAYGDVTTTIQPDKSVNVQLGGASGPMLVNGGAPTTLTIANASDGTISFALGGTAVVPSAGSLAGDAQALNKLKDVKAGLDTIAAGIIATMNTAQANGAALDGTNGQPLFSGTGASDIAVALTSGAGLATATSGSAAGSTGATNLTAMRAALTSADPAGATDALLFDISSAVAGATATRDTLTTIAGSASTALTAQSGVDLDQEAVNLVRYQQAFQASGKIMQVADTLFNTLLSIGS